MTLTRIYLPDNGLAAFGRALHFMALAGLAEWSIGPRLRALQSRWRWASDEERKSIEMAHSALLAAFNRDVGIAWLRIAELWPCAYVMDGEPDAR